MRVQNLHYTNYEGKQLLKDVSFSQMDEFLVLPVGGNGQNELSEIIPACAGSQRRYYNDGSSIKNRTVSNQKT